MAEGVASILHARALNVPPRRHLPVRSTVVAILVLAAVSVISFPSAGGAQDSGPVLGMAASSPRLARPEPPVPSTIPTPAVDPAATPPRPVVTRVAVLTPDGTDGYRFDSGADSVTVSAPDTNSNSNLRTVFWRSDAPAERDATSCATWASESSDLLQQGAALRISEGPNGSVRAITLTKNVYPYGSWIFNVHVWDSAIGRMQGIASISLQSALSIPGRPPVPQPLPWRVCARTLGPTLVFKAWRLAEPEPAWGDRRFGGSVALPRTAPTEGHTGWYAGHLHAGMTATFSDLSTDPVIAAGASGALAR